MNPLKKAKSDSVTTSTLYVDGLGNLPGFPGFDEDIPDINSASPQEIIERSLKVNLAYQELMSKNMAEAISLLTENRSQQGLLQEALDELRTSSSRPAVSAAKVPSGTFMPPYFRDRANMIPPWSQECIRIKEQYRLFNPLDDVPKRWLDRERTAMKKSIKEMSMAIRMKPLLSKKDLLVEKLRPLEEQVQSVQNGCEQENGMGNEGGDQPSREKDLPVQLQDIKMEIQRKDREISKISAHTTTDELLRSISVEHIDWWKIANFDMRGRRNPFECQVYWINYLQPGWNIRKLWEQKEVSNLKALVQKALDRGEKPKWEEISEELGTCRAPFMVFEKYQCELNDALIKRLWSPEEDELLAKVVDHCRTGDYIPWVQVAYFLDGRTIPACELRYRRVLCQNVRKGTWTIEEDMRLLDAVARFSGKDWQKISELVVTRNEIQCRDRWRNVLDGNINHGAWTCEEDERIRLGMELFGNTPAKIAKLLPGRTGAMTDKRMKHILRTPLRRIDKLSKQRVFISLSQQYWKNEVGDAYPLLGGPDSSQDKTEQFLYTLPDGIRFNVLEKLMDIRSKLFLHHLKSEASRREPETDHVTIGTSLRPLRSLPSDTKVGEVERKLLQALLLKQHTSYYNRRVEFIKDYWKLKLGLKVIEDLAVTTSGQERGDTPEKEYSIPSVVAFPNQANVSALYRLLLAIDYGPEALQSSEGLEQLTNGHCGSPEIVLLNGTGGELDVAAPVGPGRKATKAATLLRTPDSGTAGAKQPVLAGYSGQKRERSRKRVADPPAARPAPLAPRTKRPRKASAVNQGNWKAIVTANPEHGRFLERVRSVLLYPVILSTDILSAADKCEVQVVRPMDGL